MVEFRSLNGTGVSVSEDAINGLRDRLRGPLLLPKDSGYDGARAIWNGMIDRHPAVIARCLGTEDVACCIRFAREHGVLLTVKGGGHNISGLAVADDALLLDMSMMRGVWVDPRERTAWAQAGCLLGDVDRETQVHGLAAVLGFVSNTGIAGLTLGGGFGYLSRRYGWTSDNVTAIDLVTSEGTAVRASERENADLFWGLRGGGGNFGIATAFQYKLFPVGPEIIAGAVAWPATEAPRVLELYRRIAFDSPPELAVVAALRIAPPAPWLDKQIHGKPIVALFVCHSGPIETGEALVAQIKALGSPVGDILQRRTYASQQSLLDATQPHGRRYYWKSEYLTDLSSALTDRVAAHAEKIASPHSAVLLFPLQGALNDLPEDHSAVGNRDARAVVNIAASWEDSKEDDLHIGWAREAWRDMRQFSTGGTYINFLTEEEGEDRVRNAYRENYARLEKIKTKWDPDNFFRANKNIATTAG